MGSRMIGRLMALGAIAAFAIAPASGQVQTVDPNQAGHMAATGPEVPPPPASSAPRAEPPAAADSPPAGAKEPPPASQAELHQRAAANGGTYQENDVLSAAEGVFGKGAQ